MRAQSVVPYNTQTEAHLIHGHRYYRVGIRSGAFMRLQQVEIFWAKGLRPVYVASGKTVPQALELQIYNIIKETQSV